MSMITKFENVLAWQKMQELTNEVDEVGRLLAGFMIYLRESSLRGRKFK